jgi:hypothetical protein
MKIMTKFSYFVQQFDSEIRLKISNLQMELNLTLTEDESIEIIENIQKANWSERKSIKAGICLNSNVFWCINEDKSISLLIGTDDETWEIGLKISLDVIAEMKNKIGYSKEV